MFEPNSNHLVHCYITNRLPILNQNTETVGSTQINIFVHFSNYTRLFKSKPLIFQLLSSLDVSVSIQIVQNIPKWNTNWLLEYVIEV